MPRSRSDKEAEAKLLTEGRQWLSELGRESDRGAAVLAMAFVEHLIQAALTASLIKDERVMRQIQFGGFDIKTAWASALGIISAEIAVELRKLAKIRNYFGHGLHGRTFDDKGIATQCGNLRFGKQIFGKQLEGADSARGQFLNAAVVVAKYLQLRSTHLVKPWEPTGFKTRILN